MFNYLLYIYIKYVHDLMTINKYEWFIEIWTKFKYKSLNLRAGSDCLAYLPPVVIRGTAGCVTHMVSYIISGSSLVLFFFCIILSFFFFEATKSNRASSGGARGAVSLCFGSLGCC